MEIDIDSFSEFFEIKDPQGNYLGDLFYFRVKEAIEKNKSKASIYSKFEGKGIFVCSLDKDRFDIFLRAYLRRCEDREEYEMCSEICNLIESSRYETRGN